MCGSQLGMENHYAMKVCPFEIKLNRHLSEQEQSVVLVISPLISLIIDQVLSLKYRGVSAAILSSHGSIDKKLLVTQKDLHTPGQYS